MFKYIGLPIGIYTYSGAQKSCTGASRTVFVRPCAGDCEKTYFTSYNIQNKYTSHIDHKRLRGFALKLCLLRGGQLYPRGNFVMGGLYVWEADICKV